MRAKKDNKAAAGENKPSKLGALVKRLWLGVAAAIVLITAYVIVRNVVSIVDYRVRIRRLEREKRGYLESIAADSALIERLKYDEYLEEYARERYRMQRSGEQVYIVE